MSEWIGRTLSKVEVQKLVGRGGMAEVYLGQHTTLNRMVAVKVLHAHLLDDASLMNRFTAEAQAVAALRHPNIVQVFDYDVVDGRPYIVMELLEGISLKDYLEQLKYSEEKLPLTTIARLISALASALEYAHSRGIVHRDIKPANVMLRREGKAIDVNAPLPDDVELILTDFGVARIADSAGQTASGVVIGTPAYMSPEQVNGEPVDSRSDIYALGIILYELVAGRLPFDGDTQASVMIKHITEQHPPIPGISASLQSVIDKALAKNREQRFQKASELASALQGAVAGQAISFETVQDASLISKSSTLRLETREPAPTLAGVEKEKPQGNPLMYGLGVIGVVVLIGLGVLVFRPPSQNVPGSELPSEEVTPEAVVPATENTDVPPEEASPEAEGGAEVPSVPSITGRVILRDSAVEVALAGLPPPEEGTYQAWLTSEDSEPLNLGELKVAGDEAVLVFADPDGKTLIEEYAGFSVSLEAEGDSDDIISGPVIAQGTLDAELAELIAHMYEYTFQSGNLKSVLIAGIQFDAQQYNDHLGLAINAMNANDQSGSIIHSEHVINIVTGRDREDFGDWNGNGLADNPGDDVGLNVYLLILESALQSAASDPEASPAQVQALEDLAEQTAELIQITDDGKRLARSVATADTLETVRDLALQMDTLRIATQVSLLIQGAEEADLAITIDIQSAP